MAQQYGSIFFDASPTYIFSQILFLKNVKATRRNLHLKTKIHVERTKIFQKQYINEWHFTGFSLYLLQFESNGIRMIWTLHLLFIVQVFINRNNFLVLKPAENNRNIYVRASMKVLGLKIHLKILLVVIWSWSIKNEHWKTSCAFCKEITN